MQTLVENAWAKREEGSLSARKRGGLEKIEEGEESAMKKRKVSAFIAAPSELKLDEDILGEYNSNS